jgi:hypothetical protein
MMKKRRTEVASLQAFPGFEKAVGRAKEASKALGSLSNQLRRELKNVRTQRGRKRLVTRLEKEVRTLVQRPFKWIEISMRSDVTAVQRRLNVIERRLDARDEAERTKPHGKTDSEAAA